MLTTINVTFTALLFYEHKIFVTVKCEHTVICWVKEGIADPEKSAIARWQHGKYVSPATNKHVAIKELLEAMLSIWSMPKLYSEGHWKKLTLNR